MGIISESNNWFGLQFNGILKLFSSSKKILSRALIPRVTIFLIFIYQNKFTRKGNAQHNLFISNMCSISSHMSVCF